MKDGGLIKNGGLHMQTDVIAFHAMLYVRHLERRSRGRGAANEWLVDDMMKHADFSVKNAIGMVEALQNGSLPTYNPFLTSFGALMMCKPHCAMHADELTKPRTDTTMQLNLRQERMFTYAPMPRTKNLHLMNQIYDEKGVLRGGGNNSKTTLKLDKYLNKVDEDWPILANLRNTVTPPIAPNDLVAIIKYNVSPKNAEDAITILEFLLVEGTSEDMATGNCIEIEGVQVPFDLQIDRPVGRSMDDIIRACAGVVTKIITCEATKIARLFIDSQGTLRFRADARHDPCRVVIPIDGTQVALQITKLTYDATKTFERPYKLWCREFLREKLELDDEFAQRLIPPPMHQQLSERKLVSLLKLTTRVLRKRARDVLIARQELNLNHFQSCMDEYSFTDLMNSKLPLDVRDFAWITLHKRLHFKKNTILKSLNHKLTNLYWLPCRHGLAIK